jgi:hypothetical protein
MSGQPQFLTNESTDLRDQDPPSPEVPDAAVTPQRITSITYGRATPIWLQRVSLFVLVLFCVYLGVLVMVLPWWSRIWDHNALMDSYPPVAAFLRSGSVRGIISGIGLLDIWIGISEAVHYRDYRG